MYEIRQVEEYEAMDDILEYLIKNKSDRPIHSERIWKDLYADQEEEVVYFILKKIMGTVDEIVITRIRNEELDNFDVFFEANAITKRFLYEQGGFTKRFQDQQNEKAEKIRITLLNQEKLETELDIIKFQKGLGKKLTIWGFVVAVLSILISVLLSVYTNNPDKSKNSKIDSLNIRIKAVEKELLKIEKKK